MSEQLKKIMIGCGAGFVVLILILFLLTSCQGSIGSYEEYQKEMLRVARAYYESHEDSLPTEDKETDDIDLKKMVSNGDIVDISEVMGEGAKCSGSVTVTNNNGYYLYTADLDCGDDYSTQTLSSKVIEDNSVEEGAGLYDSGNGEYYFKGEKVNNYVKFNNSIWRIVSISQDGELKLLQTETEEQSSWDEHYNSESDNLGINDFVLSNGRNSSIKDFLDTLYTNKDYFTNDMKKYITTQTLCYGKRSSDDSSVDGSTECSQTLASQPLGLLAAYEPLRATLDPDCTSTESEACINYNWFFKLDNVTWLLTASTNDPRMAYTLEDDSNLELDYASNYKTTLVTITIDSKVNYTEGKGTSEKPYIITIDSINTSSTSSSEDEEE